LKVHTQAFTCMLVPFFFAAILRSSLSLSHLKHCTSFFVFALHARSSSHISVLCSFHISEQCHSHISIGGFTAFFAWMQSPCQARFYHHRSAEMNLRSSNTHQMNDASNLSAAAHSNAAALTLLCAWPTSLMLHSATSAAVEASLAAKISYERCYLAYFPATETHQTCCASSAGQTTALRKILAKDTRIEKTWAWARARA